MSTKPASAKPKPAASVKKLPPAPRLLSLDVLRGFDMFWIIGGEAVVDAIGKRWPSPFLEAIAVQFSQHREWDGFRFYDCIFPLFLFLIGAVVPFSVGRRLAAGVPREALIKKIVVRFLLLTLFGLMVNGLLDLKGWDHLRLFGVLQRQAFGYLAVSLLFLYTKPRTQVALVPAILLAYWAILRFVPVPDFAPGTYTPEGNVANYVDRLILGPDQRYETYGDPEGPLSNLPSIATALIGLLAGTYLQRSKYDGLQKSGALVITGFSLFCLGWIWNIWLPVIKKIWTSSFVLVAGGLSLMLLGIFYYVLDVRKWTRGSTFFVIVGVNAITAYMAVRFISFGDTASNILGGLMRLLPREKEILHSVGALTLVMLALWGLYKKGVTLKV